MEDSYKFINDLTAQWLKRDQELSLHQRITKRGANIEAIHQRTFLIVRFTKQQYGAKDWKKLETRNYRGAKKQASRIGQKVMKLNEQLKATLGYMTFNETV